MRFYHFICIILIFFSSKAIGQYQGTPVGGWSAFFSYYDPTSLATDGNVIFCGTTSGFFTYNQSNGQIEAYSTTNGMHDAGINAVGFDFNSDACIIGYANGNIDIFKNNTFYNIPDYKNTLSSGNKVINNAICRQSLAYLSTGFGLMIIDLNKNEIKNTIAFYKDGLVANVYDATFKNDTILVATNIGTFTSHLNNPNINYYATWNLIDTNQKQFISFSDPYLYAINDNQLFIWENNKFEPIFSKSGKLNNLSHGNNGSAWVSYLGFSDGVISETGFGYKINHLGNIIDSVPSKEVNVCLEQDNNAIWYGVRRDGLKKKTSEIESSDHTPTSVLDYRSYDVYAKNKDIYIVHGGHSANFIPNKNRNFISTYTNDKWNNYYWVSDNEWMQDFVRIKRDENTGNVYATAHAGGLLEITKDGQLNTYADGYLDPRIGENPPVIYAYGIDIDQYGNLWIANNGAINNLKVKSKEGNWYATKNINNPLTVNLPPSDQNSVGDLIVDKNDNIYLLPLSNTGGGLIVYNFNGTADDPSDDQYRVFRKGKGVGNLPSNVVLSIVEDKKGDIWVGTDNGIAIITCAYDIMDDCDASILTLQEDQFAGHFFMNQAVKAIAVDGGNRKWIGTTDGIWLVSSDGETTLERFTTDNSPLPSNIISRINIDSENGDVFISTENGLVCFRGAATEGKEIHDKSLFVYPNPVPQNYNGNIAIRGFMENTEVRITDISGNLIYRTKSNGGEVVWNGKDYTGRKAQTGVYIVLGRSVETGEKVSGKIIFRQ